jgi:hypothetical protein
MPTVDLLKECPGLHDESSFEKTSDETDSYNCVAWIVGDTTRCWWPKSYGTLVPYYWPFESDSDDIDVFIKTFGLYGYSVCESAEQEEGFEKLAIYVDKAGNPAHVAKQLPNGYWTSKCGTWEDISHQLEGLEGDYYGHVSVFMKREKKNTARRKLSAEEREWLDAPRVGRELL